LVKDIKVGECVGSWSIWDDGCSSFAGWNGLAVLGNTLFFIADDNESTLELWRTDGTAPGTVRLTTMGANAPVTAGTFVFFIGSGETLWRSDGTPDGTILLRDGLSSLHLTPMVAVGDRLFFAASDGSGTRGVELWSSDGTREGTGIVRDIRPGLYASRPFELTAMGNWLYFMIEGETHYELWRSDGSEAGTVQMAVTPMPVGGYVPSDLTAVGNQLYFSAIDEPQGNYKLWKSDSSAAGTQLVTDRVSNPTALTAFNDLLIFSGYDDTHGYELWQSDGTDAMTFMVKEFCEGTILSPWDPCHGGPSEITKVGERVFMHAYPSYRNAALYTYVPRNELPVTPTATASPTAATPTPSATASPTTTPTPSPVIQPS
ncbi:MAG: hyalin, partial [Chloroflexia bacterium]|nr:hyalin [Chloroflexia bacterium]